MVSATRLPVGVLCTRNSSLAMDQMATLGWFRSRRIWPSHRRRFSCVAAEQAVFIHDQHPQPVAGLEQFRRGRVVRGADGVATHLLEFRDAEILQGIRQRRADARVVLVIAGALEFVVLAVQQKTFFHVEPDGADAKRGFLAVNNFSVAIETVVTSL